MKLYKRKGLLESLMSGTVPGFGGLRNIGQDRATKLDLASTIDSMSNLSTSWSGESSNILSTIRAFYNSKSSLIDEYDRLDPVDSVVSAALDQYADSTIIIPASSNENLPYTFTGSSDDIDRVMKVFEYNNLNSDLWSWARQLSKIGEAFVVISRHSDSDMIKLRLEINPKKYMKLRLGEVTGIFDTEYGVFVDTDLDGNRADIEYAKLMKVSEIKVIHIKLSSRTDICNKVDLLIKGLKRVTVEHVTGSSILDPVLITTRIMRMIEDTMIMTRIEKSKITRLYNVEVGEKTPADKVKQLISKTRKLLSGRESMNTIINSFDKSSVSKVLNEIIVPTRNGIGSISVVDVDSVFNAGDLKDLQYFQTKFYAGIKIPKIYLGYEEMTPSGLGGNPLTKVETRYGRAVRRISLSLESGLQDVVDSILQMSKTKSINDIESHKVKISLLVDKTDEEIIAIQNLRDTADAIRSIGDLVDLDSRLDRDTAIARIIKAYSNTLYNAMYMDSNGNIVNLSKKKSSDSSIGDGSKVNRSR